MILVRLGDFVSCLPSLVTSDLTMLNKQVKRSTHPTLTPQQAIQGFKKSHKFFSKIDLLKGYWQMALEPESQKLTTTICSEGKYVYLRAPMGFITHTHTEVM